MENWYRPLYLLGRLANGAEADKGTLWHAVAYGGRTAVCGTRPGPRSAGWGPHDETSAFGQLVTCPRCLKRLQND